MVALTVTISAQVIRAFFPLLNFYPGIAPGIIARHLIIVFLIPLLVPFGSKLIGQRQMLIGSIVGLAILRLVLQFTETATLSLIVASFAVVLALCAQSLVFAGAIKLRQPNTLAMAVILGLILDALLNGAFLSWDYLWQRTPLAILLALAVSGTLVIALCQQRGTEKQLDTPDHGGNFWPLLLGPFWMLQLVILNNPGFVAAQRSTVLLASVVVLTGNLLGLTVGPLLARMHSLLLKLVQAILLVACLFNFTSLTTGIDTSLAVLIAQVLVHAMLFRLLTPPPPGRQHRAWITSIAFGLGMLIFVGLVALYYVGYETKAPPWTGAALQAGAGLLLAASLVRDLPSGVSMRVRRRLLSIPLVVLLIPFCLVLSLQDNPEVRPDGPHLRLMTFNIHQGANIGGWVDLEGLAQAVEAQKPDVIVLEEAVRGQLITGGADVVEWLARRLHMDYVFVPATDNTFGNALLSRFVILVWSPGQLPQGTSAQPRSFVKALLWMNGYGDITVVGTHLDNQSSTVRAQQVDYLLNAWNKQLSASPRTVIAGDMNAGPASPEIALFKAAGLNNAQEVTGNSSLSTFPSNNPASRIDWIFGSPDVSFDDFAIPKTLASDHLPVAVTIRWSGTK